MNHQLIEVLKLPWRIRQIHEFGGGCIVDTSNRSLVSFDNIDSIQAKEICRVMNVYPELVKFVWTVNISPVRVNQRPLADQMLKELGEL